MITAEANINTLSSLIRSELAAADTYEQALATVEESPAAAELMRIGREHREAVHLLQQHVLRFNGQPPMSAGPWGTWTQVVLEAASLVGDAAALQALQEGEEHAIQEYMEVLQDDDVHPACKELIQLTLLPRQREHARTLELLRHE